MDKKEVLTEKEITQRTIQEKMSKLMKWVAYYRENPQLFARDYLNIHLKPFQRILMYQMFHQDHFVYIGSRGLGKTWMDATAITSRCILYPGTKVVIAAGVKSQAIEVMDKITNDLMVLHGWGSSNLKNEIESYTTNRNDPMIKFKNGSWIKAVVANDNARGSHGNMLIIDEFRMVDKNIIDTVLRKFLTAPRRPEYLNKPEYEHLTEPNIEIYGSSAWFQSHWSFTHCQSYFANMLDPNRNYYIASIPYQMAIKEGLLLRNAVEDEMSEAGFSPVAWSYEMESLFYGASADAFFDYEVINKRRKIHTPFFPLEIYRKRDEKPPKLVVGERRILSVDVALMSSSKQKNDASSLIINSATPHTDTELTSNIVYLRNMEGATTDELGLEIMRTFYNYNCTDIVIDSNGVGLPVADYLAKDQYDPTTGQTYKAMKCVNDKAMAERCHVKDANPCLWSVKANAQFNNQINVLLRGGFIDEKINLLVPEKEGETYLASQIKSFYKLETETQALCKVPYIMTSMLINELINLKHTYVDGKVKITERSGARKDMYSSLAYNFWVVNEIQSQLKPKMAKKNNLAQFLSAQTKKSNLKIGF